MLTDERLAEIEADATDREKELLADVRRLRSSDSVVRVWRYLEINADKTDEQPLMRVMDVKITNPANHEIEIAVAAYCDNGTPLLEVSARNIIGGTEPFVKCQEDGCDQDAEGLYWDRVVARESQDDATKAAKRMCRLHGVTIVSRDQPEYLYICPVCHCVAGVN